MPLRICAVALSLALQEADGVDGSSLSQALANIIEQMERKGR